MDTDDEMHVANRSLFFNQYGNCTNVTCPSLLTITGTSSEMGQIQLVGPVELSLKVAFYFPPILIALIGNLMVMGIIISNEKLRQVNTNLYILNLSIADIMVAVFCMWTHLTTKLYTAHYWPLSSALCKIVFFMRVFVFCTSIFTLVVISLDRFLAIVFPLRFRWARERKVAIICIMFTWGLAITLALPEAIYRQLYIEIWTDRTERVCSMNWPMRPVEMSSGECRCEVLPGEYVYWLVHIIIVYYIPVSMLFITYSTIVYRLVTVKPIAGKSATQHRGRRKAIRMLIAVFVSFFICWSPMYILNTMVIANNTFEYDTGRAYSGIKYATLYIAFLNSALNPIIYAGTNENFRAGFVRIFSIFCSCQSGNKVRNFGNGHAPISMSTDRNNTKTTGQDHANDEAETKY